MDEISYESAKMESLRKCEIDVIDWVTDFPDEISLYKNAYDDHLQGKGTFKECLETLQKKEVRHSWIQI